MSRPRKPTNLHYLTGTANNSRMLNEQNRGNEPQYNDDNIIPPDHLSEKGREYWNDIYSEIASAGVITNNDVQAFALLCEELANWWNANEQVKIYGEVVEGGSGGLKVSPWVQIRNRSFVNITNLLSRFGMTPSDRSKTIGNKNGKKPENKFAGFNKANG